MQSELWGIDLGGTKIEGAIIPTHAPDTTHHRERLPTGAANGYEHIVQQVVRVVETLERQSGQARPARIGIGTPGNCNPQDGLHWHSNTQCLNGRPFRDDLAAALGVEVLLANDANCLALAEARFGAGAGYESVMGLILGTGVGGGLVVGGRLVEGRHGIAGEWGQVVLDPQGPLSNYGTRGTVETYLAGPSLERHYAALAGEARPLREIATRAEADPAAAATLENFVARFAQSVSILINLFDPHAIVIGGGVSNLPLLYTPRIREALAPHVFQKGFTTPILPARLGDSAGVFGAALLARE